MELRGTSEEKSRHHCLCHWSIDPRSNHCSPPSEYLPTMCNACHHPLLNPSIYVFVGDSGHSIDQDGSTSALPFPVNLLRGVSEDLSITPSPMAVKGKPWMTSKMKSVMCWLDIACLRVRVEDVLERGAWPIQRLRSVSDNTIVRSSGRILDVRSKVRPQRVITY